MKPPHPLRTNFHEQPSRKMPAQIEVVSSELTEEDCATGSSCNCATGVKASKPERTRRARLELILVLHPLSRRGTPMSHLPVKHFSPHQSQPDGSWLNPRLPGLFCNGRRSARTPGGTSPGATKEHVCEPARPWRERGLLLPPSAELAPRRSDLIDSSPPILSVPHWVQKVDPP